MPHSISESNKYNWNSLKIHLEHAIIGTRKLQENTITIISKIDGKRHVVISFELIGEYLFFFLKFTRRSNPKFKPVRPFNYKTNNACLSEFQLLLSNICNVYKLFQVSI